MLFLCGKIKVQSYFVGFAQLYTYTVDSVYHWVVAAIAHGEPVEEEEQNVDEPPAEIVSNEVGF